MRLIDADALLYAIDTMYRAKKDIVPDNFAEGCMQMHNLIKQQPTAYDVNKVIEQIKISSGKGIFKPCDFTGLIGSMSYKGSFISTEKAIDIVKRGGLDD